jgi:hypothetical protein
MKKIIFSLAIPLLLTSCFYGWDNNKKTVKGSGVLTKEQRHVTSFDKIEIASGAFEVYLLQGDTESVEVETDDNLHQYVRVQNYDNTLVLDLKEKIRFSDGTQNTVYITMKSIDAFKVTGVCNLITPRILNLNNLELEVSGVFNGELGIHCNKLIVSVKGVSNTELSGKAEVLKVTQSGVGSFDAMNLIGAKVTVNNSGVGSVSVYATDELSMTNSGIGSIYYSGEASILHLESSGLGKIEKR